MTPTLVFKNGKVVGCLGGSGGPRIISNVLQVFLNAFENGMDAVEAVSAPRIHHQWTPDRLVINEDSPSDIHEALRKKGHKLGPESWKDFRTAVQLILVNQDGRRHAASDPRKGGQPAVQ